MPKTSFSTDKSGYLTFNGVTFTQLINDSLRSNSVFTEQDLTGSNLAAIHQSLGYVMSVMLLYVNEQSGENKFVDSNVYKNMNRVVKSLGYNPIGAQTSTLAFTLSAQGLNKGFYIIPRYSSIDAGGVKFSTNEDIVFAKTTNSSIESLNSVSREKLLYQGTFVEHSTLSAAGIANEILYLSVDDKTTIDHFNINVYVLEADTDTWHKWNASESLYPLLGQERAYTIRLNHNKRYELQFGDDINGKQLQQGDQIAVYYLKTDGSNGEVGSGAINNRAMTAFDTIRLRSIIADTETTSMFTRMTTTSMRSSLVFNSSVGSTYFSVGDGVKEMRDRAPNTFRSQYRLVHEDDYKAFVQTNFANVVHDVFVCNNAQYLDQYMKYYHDLGLTDPSSAGRPLFNQIRFGTTCNFNNIYIVAVPKTANPAVKQTLYLSPALKQKIKTAAAKIKTATSEVMFVDPIYITCDFGVRTSNTITQRDISDTRLVITQDAKSIKSPSLIQSEVAAIITGYFQITNQQIGQTIDISKMVSDIIAINGVQQVYTVNSVTGTQVPGISLYLWDSTYPEQSLTNITSTFQMSNFQIAHFNNASNIIDRIVVNKDVRAYSTFEV